MIGQTFSLYNVSGLVDKSKNIYYVPLQSVLYAKRTIAVTRVCDCYKSLFDEVCPPSSPFVNVEISQWSPEDRSLRVVGNIDDFRVSRGGGLALNYLIVTRTVNEGEQGERTYYYSFFIDSVRQAGIGSVDLILTPDHFTNFFYLNNEEDLTADYDPFNPVMRNCYVERQHYDRVENKRSIDSSVVLDIDNLQPNTKYVFKLDIKLYLALIHETLRIGNGYFNVEYINQNTLRNTGEVVPENIALIQPYPDPNASSDRKAYRDFVLNTTIPPIFYRTTSYIVISYNEGTVTHDIVQGAISYFESNYVGVLNEGLQPVNQEKILGSEESFKFKFQFKDFKYLLPIGLNVDFNDFMDLYDSLKEINSLSSFKSFVLGLSDNELTYLSAIFTAYLNIDFKENFLLPITYSFESGEGDMFQYRPAFTSVDPNKHIQSPITHIVIPYIDIPYDLGNIQPEWITIGYRLKMETGTNPLPFIKSFYDSPTYALDYLKSIGASQYILSAYISKYSPLQRFVYVDNSNGLKIYFDAVINQFNSVLKDVVFGTDYSTESEIIVSNNPAPAYLPPYHKIPLEIKSTLVVESYDVTINPNGYYDNKYKPLFYIENNTVKQRAIDLAYVGGEQGGEFLNYNQEPFIPNQYTFCFVLPDTLINEFNFRFKDLIKNVKNEYYETILESDPYTFYSMSISETEQIISKMRYFNSLNNQGYKIVFKPIISYNESYKIGLIPIYDINNVDYIRYNGEALVYVTSSQLPIVEDSWLTYYTNNKYQMKSQYAVQQNNFKSAIISDYAKTTIEGVGNIVNAGLSGKTEGQIYGEAVKTVSKQLSGVVSNVISNAYAKQNIGITQMAKMGDMGASPDTVKLSGSDMLYELSLNELGIHINHYTIDRISYNSIAKYLERTGYLVNIMDSLNPFNRVGLNYIKLTSFDFVEDSVKISSEQSDALYDIFAQGVTLLHDKDFLHNLGETGYHNYETSLIYYEGGDN